MGRSVTPAYRVEYTDGTGGFDLRARTDGKRVKLIAWNSRSGRPTAENLAKVMTGLGKSFEKGGVNAHVSDMLGKIPYPTWARIVAQKGPRKDEVVAEWSPGPFLVW